MAGPGLADCSLCAAVRWNTDGSEINKYSANPTTGLPALIQLSESQWSMTAQQLNQTLHKIISLSGCRRSEMMWTRKHLSTAKLFQYWLISCNTLWHHAVKMWSPGEKKQKILGYSGIFQLGYYGYERGCGNVLYQNSLLVSFSVCRRLFMKCLIEIVHIRYNQLLYGGEFDFSPAKWEWMGVFKVLTTTWPDTFIYWQLVLSRTAVNPVNYLQ